MCCMMMFRWTNKQPGIQKFWNLCCHYQDSYDWISPLNKRSGLPFILTQQSMGRKISINLVTCLFSLLWCTYWCFWGASFSGLHFYTLWKTLIACRDMQLRFLRVKSLLNNAFKCADMNDKKSVHKPTLWRDPVIASQWVMFIDCMQRPHWHTQLVFPRILSHKIYKR